MKSAFQNNSEFKDAFEELTPGKKREYAEYIALAKREETKQSRLKKITPMVIAKVALNDKYKNC